MPQTISRDNAEHYRWGTSCDGWHLLREADLGVIEEAMPPGTVEQRHRHRHARQFFYVLDGVMVLECEGTRHTLQAGQGLHIAPGSAHQVCNESEQVLRFLAVSSPHSHADRVAAPQVSA